MTDYPEGVATDAEVGDLALSVNADGERLIARIRHDAERIAELRKAATGWEEMVKAEAAELGFEWHDYGGVVPGDFKALIRAMWEKNAQLRAALEKAEADADALFQTAYRFRWCNKNIETAVVEFRQAREGGA